jgi:hypothetical protein
MHCHLDKVDSKMACDNANFVKKYRNRNRVIFTISDLALTFAAHRAVKVEVEPPTRPSLQSLGTRPRGHRVSAGKCLILYLMARPSLQSARPEPMPLPPVVGAWHCGIVGGRGWFRHISDAFADSVLDSDVTAVSCTIASEQCNVFRDIVRPWPSSLFARPVCEPVDTWDHGNTVECLSSIGSVLFPVRSFCK